MNALSWRARGRALPMLMAAVLTMTTLVLGAGQADAATSARLSGSNRYATAAKVAVETFPGGVTDAVLATGDNYPDALAASGLAGALGGPVLLTDSERLSAAVKDALSTLGVERVHLAGGGAAVGAAVEEALDELGYVTARVAGSDRYETAARIAREVAGRSAVQTAIVTTGENYADAVTVGPLAYDGPNPILLVEKDRVPPATRDALAKLDVSDVVVVGGSAAVSNDVMTNLSAITGDSDVVRLSGPSRNETAVAVATYALEHAGFGASTVLLANGWQNLGVDALAGGPHGGEIAAPILFVSEGELPPSTATFLSDQAAAISRVRAFGGGGVIADSTLAEAGRAATPEAGETNETLTVAPAADATMTLGAAREYTIRNTVAGRRYSISLADADHVDVRKGGVVAFQHAAGVVGPGAVGGHLSMVNGVATSGEPTTVAATSSSRSLTFTVSSTVWESLVPVVFSDDDGDGAFAVKEDGVPEPDVVFGIGGRATWMPPEEEDNHAVSGTVVGTGRNYAIVDPGSEAGDEVAVYFGPDDSYHVFDSPFCATATEEAFFADLSKGDRLDSVLGTDPSPGPYDRDGGTAFCVHDTHPTVPLDLVTSGLGASGVTLEWGTVEHAEGYAIGVAAGSCPTEASARLPIVASTHDTTYEVSGLTAVTDYCVGVAAVSGSDQSDFAWTPVQTTEVPDTDRPTITKAYLFNDDRMPGIVTGGDEWVLQFSEVMDAGATEGGRLLLEDDDGSQILAACGAVPHGDLMTATLCSWDDESHPRTMTVKINEVPELRTIGDGTLTYPLMITSFESFTDTAANNLDLAASDVVIEPIE